jgi:diguanylate cyclase (GGDEF)-like protein/PAS domain S-box-containing protein
MGDMFDWVRSIRQPTTYLGVVVIALIWIGVFALGNQEHDRAYEDAVRQGSNLAQVLEEYVQRIVKQSDTTLLALRRDYQLDPQHFDMTQWTAVTQFNSDLTAHIGITDAEGFVILSSRGPLSAPRFVGDRAPFTFQRDNPGDQLYISDPLTGNVSKELTIEFTRRFNKPDGRFAGTVAVALSVAEVEKFFDSLDLGPSGVVSLIHSDGIVLARGGLGRPNRGYAGSVVSSSPLFSALRQAKAGHFWNTAASSARFDGVRRLISYRALTGVPIIALVGIADDTIFQHADAMMQKYIRVGVVLSFVVLLVMFFGVIRHRQMLSTTAELQNSKQSLERSIVLLNTALKHMAHGLCMFDNEGRLVICNDRYGDMYGLKSEQVQSGTTLRSILEARVEAGMSPEDAAHYINTRLQEVAVGKSYYAENQLSNGRIYAVSHEPMPGGGWVATHIDITEQERAERALEQTKQFLDSIIENIPVSVAVKDAVTHEYVLVNRAFESMLDVPRDELLGRTAFDILSQKDAAAIYGYDSDSTAGNGLSDYREYEIAKPKGGHSVQATRRIAVRDNNGVAKYLVTVIEDITERKKADQRIAFLAHHDALTGLANRVALNQKIEEAAARMRHRGEAFSILLLDLDRFKHVNDTMGHPAGDALLIEVAMRLKSVLRETDVLARLGGDEFAIIQAGELEQSEAAEALAGRIIDKLDEPFEIEGSDVTIGTSIGIALASEHNAVSNELLKMADLALYRAKTAGRNRYSVFTPEMSEIAATRQAIENDLRRAIQQNEFVLHYQPIIDSRSGKICSAEALIRWHHPTKGLIYPDSFIPLAEETGLIIQIGDWVLHNACAQAMAWPPDVKVAVNLSLTQFNRSNLPDIVMLALVETGLKPERLELEVTETALLESAAECLPALRQFKSLGITIVLDDFGTGYSSLSQLAKFPFDKIKIDKSFTQNMTKRSDCAAIISATLTLAKSLDIATTAEGVETVDQARILRLTGVTSLQGYLFKRPVPANEIDFNSVFCGKTIERAA